MTTEELSPQNQDGYYCPIHGYIGTTYIELVRSNTGKPIFEYPLCAYCFYEKMVDAGVRQVKKPQTEDNK